MCRLLLLCAVLWGIQPASAGQFGFQYTDGLFTTIQDALNDPSRMTGTNLRGINDAGVVVGWSFQRAFTYAAGTFTTLSDPLAAPGTEWFPSGINNAGQIVGFSFTPHIENAFHGFLYSNGTFTTLDDPLATFFGSSNGAATAINNVGQIVGSYFDQKGPHGYIDTNGSFTTLDHPLGTNTQPTGINDAGQIVGMYLDLASNTTRGFLYQNGTFTDFEDPLAMGRVTQPRGINNAGQIVGWSVRSFLDSDGTFVTIADPLGTGGTNAYGINNQGQIVGDYEVQLISPEPSTVALMCLGLFLVLAVRARVPGA